MIGIMAGIRHTAVWMTLATVALALPGCSSSQPRPRQQYPAGQPPPYGPGQPPTRPGQPPAPGYPPAPGQPPPAPQYGPPPPQIPSQPMPPVLNDPINRVDIMFLRQRAKDVLGELVAALPPARKAMVQSIPLAVDDGVGEVNAFAACIQGKALMAITDGLLEIQSQMARSKATDDVFRTNKFQTYVQFIAKNQRPKRPIVRPAANFYSPVQDTEGRKVARQHQLFDEQLAFVLGHELAHHYLLHTGCAGPQSAMITPSDINRVLSNVVPGFNQPNEIASDQNGVQNALSAGARRNGYKWTEGGAMLTLEFFLALKSYSPAEAILFAFEISHPHPAFRKPIVQRAANDWRASGGQPTVTFPFPIPGF